MGKEEYRGNCLPLNKQITTTSKPYLIMADSSS